jgi:hypothetical protein
MMYDITTSNLLLADKKEFVQQFYLRRAYAS